MKSFLKSAVEFIITSEARAALKKYKPRIIAVTGNVGKTSTKDAVYAIVSGFSHARKSEKSFNSEIGVPLSIIGCPNAWNNPFLWLQNFWKGFILTAFSASYPKVLVLEIGADRPGDIRRIAEWLRPDAVIVTKMSKVPVHIEFFKNAGELLREKGYLVGALKDGGLLVLNGDDRDVMSLRDEKRDCRVITFGLEPGNDITASHIETSYGKSGGLSAPQGVTFKVQNGGSVVPIRIEGSLGRQHMYPVLAALALGLGEGRNLVEMGEKLADYSGPNGRMKIVGGIKNTTIIDDSYNSSPLAAEEALATLRNLDAGGGRKIAVLGDMLELGKYSVAEHLKLGKQAAEAADLLATVGLRARSIAEGALDAGMEENKIFQFDDPREAGVFIQNLIAPGDIVLVKGSQGVRMERTVEEIMAKPEDKEKLLVRQDTRWKKKRPL